jgi:hypothetical protein
MWGPLQPLSLLSSVLLFLIISPFNKRKGKEIKEGEEKGLKDRRE